MGFFRLLVAHCDGEQYGSRCFTSQRLDPNSTQPFVDLTRMGWTVAEDGETLYCPKHTKEETDA